MANEDLTIKLGLTGQPQVKKGLEDVAKAETKIGTEAREAGAKSRVMGASIVTAGNQATVSMRTLVGAIGIVAGARGLGRLALAGAKWGLQTNAQIEQARLRFSLFTDDVDGLTASVRQLDKNSAFSFADLADSAATLGGSGIKDVPTVLQAIANSAAAGGKGAAGLQAITLALSQIQSKGRLSQEEVNQLVEGGALTAQRDLAKGLNLTTKELQNLGGAGIEGGRAIDVLTKAWTSGPMADLAKRQTQTLGGQWNLFTGNAQTAAAVATKSLANGLRDDVLPAANDALTEITRIFGQEGISNEEKLRQARRVINRELGPIADDLLKKLDDADIPGHLGALVGAAAPKMAAAAADAAPEAAKAFVDAWLASGPWVQLLTALAVYKKIGAPGLPGKGGGGFGGAVSRATPMPVWVTNWGGVPGGSPMPGGKGGRFARFGAKLAPVGAAVGGSLAPEIALGTASFAAGGYAGHKLGGMVDLHDEGYDLTRNLINRFGLGSVFREGAPAGNNPATRAIRGTRSFVEDPFVINNNMIIDGKVVAKNQKQVELRREGRSG